MRTVTYRTGVFLTEETLITHYIDDTPIVSPKSEGKLPINFFSRPEVVRKNSKSKRKDELHSSGS